MDVSSSDQQQQQQQQQQMFPSTPIETNIQQQNQQLQQPGHIFSTNYNNHNFTNSNSCNRQIGTSDVKTILQQPISNLRCNRRRSSTRYQSLSNENSCTQQQQQQHSDILDYIDKIPIDNLERGLFNQRTGSSTIDSVGQFQGNSDHHQYQPHHQIHQNITTLEKPTVFSPSPPKMYRMSMF